MSTGWVRHHVRVTGRVQGVWFREGVRREAERLTVEGAERARAELPAEHADAPALVLAGEGWHPGVVGVAASRMVERHFRPTVLLSVDGPRAKGSARSIPGFDVVGALEACSGQLLRYGGHRAAADQDEHPQRLPDEAGQPHPADIQDGADEGQSHYQGFFAVTQGRQQEDPPEEAGDERLKLLSLSPRHTAAPGGGLFADLLPILEPMGFHLEYQKGEGPVIHNPLTQAGDVDRVRVVQMKKVEYFLEIAEVEPFGRRVLHGLDFAEVATFDWSAAIVVTDARRDYPELRFRAYGRIGATRRGAASAPGPSGASAGGDETASPCS